MLLTDGQSRRALRKQVWSFTNTAQNLHSGEFDVIVKESDLNF